jgi:hypothetical protein
MANAKAELAGEILAMKVDEKAGDSVTGKSLDSVPPAM